jgi:vacuolar-type H+-ATPase subunit F/Vma7
MAHEHLALITLPGGYWGAEEAGISVITVAGPERLAETIRELVAGGEFAVIAVSEAAAAGVELELGASAEQAPAQVSIVLVPAPGERTVAGLAELRGRFAAALGVDVWTAAAARAGFDE